MMNYDEILDSDVESEGDESQRISPTTAVPQGPEQVVLDELMALRIENQELKEELKDLRKRVRDLEDDLMKKNVELGTVAIESEGGDEDHEFQTQYSSPGISGKKWTFFTKEEDKKIMSFLKRNYIRHSHIGIRSGTWDKMKEEVFPESSHTVQSLENRYRRSIVPNLRKFFSSEAELKAYQRRVESPIKKRGKK